MDDSLCLQDMVKYLREVYPKATKVILTVTEDGHYLETNYYDPDRYDYSMKTLDGNWLKADK